MERRVSSEGLRLRPMCLEDIDRVHGIDEMSFSLPWSARSYVFELTENHNSLLWVAEIDAEGGLPEVIGMIVAWVILDEAHIATLAVDPNYRRLGAGKRLLTQALREAFERGARLAYLEVRRSNLAAQALYTAFGFEVVGERRRYYKDNQEDALLMTLADIEAALAGR